MKRRIRVLPRAAVDIEAISAYFEIEAGPDLSHRFTAGLQSSMNSLIRFPNRGREHILNQPLLRSTRAVLVDGFPNYLMIYRPVPGWIEIVRVIHAMRDLSSQDFD